MRTKDLKGNHVYIPFYIAHRDGFLLLGSEILHESDRDGPSNEIRIPPGVRNISDEEVVIPTYFEAPFGHYPEAGRT